MTTIDNTKHLAEISTLSSASERTSAMNWLAAQSEEVKISTFERHGSLLKQKIGPGETASPSVSYCLLILAAKQIRIDMSALSFKRELSTQQTEEISRQRIEGFRKPKKVKGCKKLNRLRIEFLPLIVLLNERHHYSWSEIVKYLWTHHKFDISKAYLQTSYKKLTAEVKHGK